MLGLAPLGTPLSALSGTVYVVDFFTNGYGANAYGSGNYGRSGSDSLNIAISIDRSVSESVTASDSEVSILNIVSDYSETVTLSDSSVPQLTSYIGVSEVDLSALDDISPAGSIYFIQLLEYVASLDALTARLLWEPESDTAESWAPESDTSSIWTNSSDNSYNWTNIDDTPDTWTPVADGSTTWTPI
jgi:hypothetical protein